MTARPVIGVVGLGTMGLGIAQVYAQAGFPVIATDAHGPARDRAKAKLAGSLDERVAAGKMNAEARDALLARLTVTDSLGGMTDAALVVEAIAENLDSKHALFAALEAIVAADAVLATNTSSLSVTAMAQALRHPERLVGLHFFNPPPVMKLVELIGHDGSSQAALDAARNMTAAAGKTVIACPDRPGFIVNRCARPFYGEALAMLEEGRGAGEIDAAMMQAGYRMGPFTLIDLIGADVHLAATDGVSAGMNRHPRYHVFDALKRQVASGKLGRKSGQGFVFPGTAGPAPADAAGISLRIEAVLANEAASLLQAGGVSAASIDTAMKLGMNFPRGPFEAARALGLENVRATLRTLENLAPRHLKGRYRVVDALESLV